MKRRVVIRMSGAAAALGWAVPGLAQPSTKLYRIGMLSEALPRDALLASILRRLKAFGYEEGRNLAVDFKYADGRPELLQGLGAQLVAAKPDLILAPLNREAVVLKSATSTIPIVMVFVSCPAETGLIASLARPGGNLTGTTTSVPVTAGKMLQMLRDAVPRMSRVTWVGEPDYPCMPQYLKEVQKAAAAMGLRLSFANVRSLADLEDALAAMARERPEGAVVSVTGTILFNEPRIIEFMSRMKIPALYTTPRPARMGGLISFSADFGSIMDRAAWIADKVLKGAKPRDIPVEEPSRFKLSINMKTAKSMGFTFPRSFMMQVDEVFE